MNKEPKPRASLSREELLQAMDLVIDLIIEDNFNRFLDRVYSAIEIYLDLDEPSGVAKELREINRICQRPNYTLLSVLGYISKSTRELLDGKAPLPSLRNKEDEVSITEFAK